jgi:hypothetical protein
MDSSNCSFFILDVLIDKKEKIVENVNKIAIIEVNSSRR